jgi:hedgehog protein
MFSFLSFIMNLFKLLIFATSALLASACGPGRGPMRRRGPRKILPLIYKQHEPNFSERSLAASGLPDGSITREDKSFRTLVPNYNPDISFKDEEGTGADRIMTQRCKEKLNTLAISVMNQWPGVRLRVTEGWDEENHHARDSLHYEGRAVDITTSDRDRAKYGLLASLAVEAGFDWVYYESRSHVHASCRAESAHPSKNSGCFTGEGKVVTESGEAKNMSQVVPGDMIQAVDASGNIVYSEVLMFMDREPSEHRKFVTITTEAGVVLTLTATHLVHTGGPDCDHLVCFVPSYAGNVQKGQKVMVSTDTLRPSVVVRVEVTSHTGVYAPLTAVGNLVVDGVLASCYAVIDSQRIAHAAFAPVRWWYSAKHMATHAWRTLSFTNSATYAVPRTGTVVPPPTGIHWYPDFLYSLARFVLPSHMVW